MKSVHPRSKFDNLYCPEPQRKCTDVLFTIFAALFAITLFVTANILWNRCKCMCKIENFNKKFASFYGKINEVYCQQGLYLVYQNPENLENYSCVKACPVTSSNINGLCLPMGDESRNKLLDHGQVAAMVYGRQFKSVIFYTILISLSLGLFNLFLVNVLPKFSVRFNFFACVLLLLAVGILLLVIFWRQNTLLKIIVAIICFFLALIILVMLCMYSNEIKMHSIFVEYAVHYLNQNYATFLYIPLFLIFMAGLVALCVWQHCCFSSAMGTSKNIFNPNNSGIWGVLNILQFIWGVRFLRDAFNFCVSGNVVDWYFQRQGNRCYMSFKRLICKNWGSVVAGSFFNAFFQIPTLIFALFRCHPDTLCNSAGNACSQNFNCLSNLFDLVRTDVYSFINLSGNDYCHSANQCRTMCEKSNMFVGPQSPMNHYRFTVHVSYITVCFLISWFIQRYRTQYYGIWNNAIVIIISLIVITWFLSIFSDVAQGIQTCFICERGLESDYSKMNGLNIFFKDDLEHHQLRKRKDGQC